MQSAATYNAATLSKWTLIAAESTARPLRTLTRNPPDTCKNLRASRNAADETVLNREQIIDHYCRRRGEGEKPRGSVALDAEDEDGEPTYKPELEGPDAYPNG